MAATVTGTFQIIDRASGPMRRMEEQAERTDKQIRQLGDSLDDIGTNKQLSGIEDTERKLRDLDRTADELGGTTGQGSIGEVADQVDRLGQSTSRSSRGINLFSNRLAIMAGAVAVAAPVLMDLVGALGALIGSLGRATVGAAAFAVGIGGVATVAIGGLAGAIAPAVSRLGELNEAYKGLTEAQQTYGASSKEAREEAKALEEVQKRLKTQGFAVGPAMNVLDSWTRFREDWMQATQPGQREFFGMLGDEIERLQGMLPELASVSNRTMAAARVGVDQFMDRLDGPETKTFLDRMTTVTERIMPDLGAGLGNSARVLMRIARAVAPDLERLAGVFEDTSEGWLENTRNQKELRQEVHGLVKETGDWWALLKSAWNLMTAVFGSGADEGQGLVKDMTAKMKEWTSWVEKNPDKMNKFWEDSIGGTKRFARWLGQIRPFLDDILDAMEPISELIMDVTGGLAEIKIGGPEGMSALTAVLAGAAVKKTTGGIWGVRGPAGAGSILNPINVVMGGIGSIRDIFRRGGGRTPGRTPTPTPGGGTGGRAGAAGGLLGKLGSVGRIMKPLGIFAALDSLMRGEGLVEAGYTGLDATFGFGMLPGGAPSAVNTAMAGVKAITGEQEYLGGERAQRITGAFGMSDTSALPPYLGMDPDKFGQRVDRAMNRFGITEIPRTLEQAQKMIGRLDQRTDRSTFFDMITQRRYSGHGRGLGFAGAVRDTFQDVMGTFRGLGDKGRKQMAQNMISWAREIEKRNPRMKGLVDDVSDWIEKRYRGMGDNVRVVNGKIVDNNKSRWDQVKDILSTQAENASRAVGGAWDKLKGYTTGMLTKMGVPQNEASRLVAGVAGSGADKAMRATKGVEPAKGGGKSAYGGRAAGGGRLPGIGGQDSIAVPGGVAAPGELWVNRHTEQRVDNKLAAFGTSLDREVRNERVPHSAKPPSGGVKTPSWLSAHAKGGRAASAAMAGVGSAGVAQPPGDPGSEVVQAGYEQAVGQYLSRYGMDLTQGYNPSGPSVSAGHNELGVPPSLDVVPLNGDWGGSFLEGLRWAEGQGMKVIYGSRGVGIPLSNHGEGNHAHVDWSDGKLGKMGKGMNGAAMMGYDPIKLVGALRSTQKGIPGAAAQRGMDLIAAGAEKKINRKLGTMGGAVGAGVSAAGGSVRSWLTQALRITGHFSPANLDALYGRAMQESGGDPTIVNNWDSNAAAGTPSIGLLQTIGPTFDAYKMKGMNNIRDPIHNAVAAIRYMMDVYGHIVGPSGSGYSKGGRAGAGAGFAGWFGSGGTVTADRPTLLGIGESGKETAVITRGGGERPSISIGHMSITNNRKGDIKKQVKEELDEAFREFAREIEEPEVEGVI